MRAGPVLRLSGADKHRVSTISSFILRGQSLTLAGEDRLETGTTIMDAPVFCLPDTQF